MMPQLFHMAAMGGRSLVARILYTLLFTLLLPVFVARLWWRGRKNPGYRRRIGERFGRLPHAPRPNGLWVHAVSVGETLAAAPFCKSLSATVSGRVGDYDHHHADGFRTGAASVR